MYIFFFQLSNTNSVKILIGSKCDNETNRKISMKEGQRVIILL